MGQDSEAVAWGEIWDILKDMTIIMKRHKN